MYSKTRDIWVRYTFNFHNNVRRSNLLRFTDCTKDASVAALSHRQQTLYWLFTQTILSSIYRNKPIVALTYIYYVASSASGQDEPNRALWLATRAGKMEPFCPLGTTRCIPQAKFHQKPYNKSFIDQVCSVKMAGYWPRSFFASLWTSTSSRSVNTQKKNLANILPSSPPTWSITHT